VQAWTSSPVKSARGQPVHAHLVARAVSGKLLASFLTLALAVVAGMSGPFICGYFYQISRKHHCRFRQVSSRQSAGSVHLPARRRQPCPPQGPWSLSPKTRALLTSGSRAMAPHQDTTDEGATPADLDRQLLLYRLQRFGLIETCAEGGWRLTQHAAAGLAVLPRGGAHACAAPEPVRVRPWTPRKLSRAD
jgi:hypothetical protein